MNKNIVDNLIKGMVQVLIVEVDTVINKSNLIFTHKTDRTVGSLIAKSIGKYGLEWSSDIIRDEVVATLYEAMLTVAEGKDIEELRLDKPAFMGPVYNLTELKIKSRLIPASKLNRDGEIIGYTEEFVSPVAEDGEATSKLENMLNGQIEFLMENKEEKMNQFIKWFNANKKTLLTKKQRQFIDGELIDMDRHSACKIRKRIAERVGKAYEAKYGSVTPRIATLMDQQETIEAILEAKDFRAALLPYMEENYIIDTIMDNVSPEASKAFNTGSTAA